MFSKKKWTAFDFDKILAQTKETSALPSPQKNNALKYTTHVELSTKSSSKGTSFNFFKEIEPQRVDELAIHSKKLSELESWLEQCVLQPQQESSLLLITGPSGCGKTAATRVLCQKMSIGITEWQNPVNITSFELDGTHFNGYVNQATRFTEFLVESNYGNLFSRAVKNIALVKDFPNMFLKNPDEFTTVLEDIYNAGNVKVIFIATDDVSTSLNIERNLFPDTIKARFNVKTINFNACAATLLKNAMKRARQLVQYHPDLFDVPSDHVVEAICSASTGDIRCGMNQFYLAALRGSQAIAIEMKVATETKTGLKRKRPTKTATLKTKLKDQTLGLFHSVGRVLHPKIDAETRKIHHDLELLIDEFSTMPSVFLGFLHENYVRYFGDVGDSMHASNYLSVAQGFMEKWSEMYHETCRIGLYIAVMGLMLHNKNRISMWNPIKGPKKVKYEETIISRETGRIVSPMEACYYNMIIKGHAFHRFEKKL